MRGALGRRLAAATSGGDKTVPAAAPETGARRPALVDCGLYRDGVRLPGAPDIAALYERARREPDAFVWLGLYEPDEAMLTEIAAVFGLHPLAVEDVLQQERRPKLERYEDVSFLVLRAAQYVEHAELTETSEVVDTGTVRIFVSGDFVITIRHGSVGELTSVRTDLEAGPALLAQGPWAVVHAVVDRIVDAYVDIAAAVQTDLDAVEAAVFTRTPGIGVEHIYQLKRELLEFRSAVLPLQRPLGGIVDGHSHQLPKEVRRYFRDVADHHARVVEQITSYDELLASILQARLGQVTIDQNNDMRKIASWAAIAAMQTAIAGVYGMNFTFMPELEWRYGYPGVLTLMLISAVVLYRILRRAGWL
ncbi:magnesium/cobalt transporter CorA [Actinoplanes sp. NEAU-A12]|uniref:Magnesium transport protein CorA n=1 Tax=Actinoplanes sandaracinus TaxID=3045177 RepID=A0ABT6X1N1_9ACTN|nr:magnesium/cobalt transporter CorA [Actinoplanes sandaracinus]MDI6105913.1 magnesium/cobalt transporter CorA [Actinoplanes sandaracinus]